MLAEETIQVYENYDRAMAYWVSETVSYNSKKVPLVFATPERALARMQEKLKSSNIPVPEVIPLPFSSLNRTGESLDAERFVNYTFRRFYDEESGNYISVQRPTPVNIVYQLHFWARNLSHLDMFRDQILRQLRFNEKYLEVELPDPFGNQLCRLTLEEIQPAPPGDIGKEQRALRRVFVFNLCGWICHVTSELSRIEKVGVVVATSDDLENIDEVITEIEIPEEES